MPQTSQCNRRRIVAPLAAALIAAGLAIAPAPAQTAPAAAPDSARHSLRRDEPRASTAAQRPAGSPWLNASGMVLLLAVIGVLAWTARRQGWGTDRSSQSLAVVTRLALTQRHGLHIVRAGGQHFLIGTGQGSAPTLLAALGENLPEDPIASAPVIARPPRPGDNEP